MLSSMCAIQTCTIGQFLFLALSPMWWYYDWTSRLKLLKIVIKHHCISLFTETNKFLISYSMDFGYVPLVLEALICGSSWVSKVVQGHLALFLFINSS